MKTLIAVVNARHRPEWLAAVRSSWMPKVPKDKADVFFFVGRGEPIEDLQDVVELDCSDKYEHMPEKIKTIAKWALEHAYEYMLKCDDDVILKPSAILASGYDTRDYTGRANRPPQPYVVPMGFCYWLSRKSMNVVAESPLPPDGSNDDEKWTAKHLWEHDIKLFDDRRYFLHLWKMCSPAADAKRSLRAPKRDKMFMPDIEASGFSWCIHLAAEQYEKIAEFKKVYERYVKDFV